MKEDVREFIEKNAMQDDYALETLQYYLPSFGMYISKRAVEEAESVRELRNIIREYK